MTTFEMNEATRQAIAEIREHITHEMYIGAIFSLESIVGAAGDAKAIPVAQLEETLAVFKHEIGVANGWERPSGIIKHK